MLEIKKIVKQEEPIRIDSEGDVANDLWWTPETVVYELCENGEKVQDILIQNKGRNIIAESKESCTRLIKYRSIDFPISNLNLNLNNLEEFGCLSLSAMITKIVDKEDVIFVSEIGNGTILALNINLFKWEFDFSFNTYKERFLQNANKSNFKKIDYGVIYGLPFIQFELNSDLPNDISIEIYLNEYIPIIKETHHQTIAQITKSLEKDKLVAKFDFPEELKTTCKQYLEYFAQFLKDLGINATSNQKEEAGKVLFSVTPTDDIEALEKIREALAIYLSLASNPIPHSTGDRTVDMVLSGVRANAKHLESQLELAIAKAQFLEATLELKEETHQIVLQRRDETIKGLQEIVAQGNIFEESLEKIEVNGEEMDAASLYRFSRGDDEIIEVEATPVLDESNDETKVGLVEFHKVTKYKDYGVSFDLPKAIRGLMDFFKRNKED